MRDMITTTLNDVCRLVTDGTHDTPKPVKRGIPLVKAKEIVGGWIDFDTCDQICYEDHLKVISRSKPECSDILFAHIGASLGEAAFIKTTREFSIKNIALFKPDPIKIENRYLYYYVINSRFQEEIKLIKTGSAQPFVGLGTLRNHTIEIHKDIEIQRQIASILSTYDDLIENNTRRIKILEEMARMLYREWFVNFRFPWHEKVKMVDSSLGRIPEGWEVKALGDIAQELRRGVNPEDVAPETPYFGLEHLPRRSIAITDWGVAEEVQSTKLSFRKGEILFGKIRPYFHKVGVAPVDGICSSDTIVISTKDRLHFPLVLGSVTSDNFVTHATKTSQGTKMPRADWKVLVKYPVAIPPNRILLQFNSFINNALGSILNLAQRNRTLRQTRDLLLPKLISGEIEV